MNLLVIDRDGNRRRHRVPDREPTLLRDVRAWLALLLCVAVSAAIGFGPG